MHRLHVIDSPYFDCSDIYGLRQEAALSAKMGFTGKMAIHPSQIVEINDAFLPTKEKIDWARQIVIEANKQTSAIFKIDGKMIGPPIVEGAKRLIEYYNSFFATKV
jgi:citrate lyase beta subunit